MGDDVRIQIAHGIPMAEVIDRLQIGGLVRTGAEMVGPCPSCGGKDRFGVHLQKGIFLCRRCDAKGDQIALVQLALSKDFPSALEWLAGPRQELTSEERAEIDRKARANRKERDAEAAKRRGDAIRLGQKIWSEGRHANDTVVVEYLALRGLAPRPGVRLPACFRFEPDARLVVPLPNHANQFQTVHSGPAMLSAILGPDGSVIGVHRTWIDLTQRKGRPVIQHPFKSDETVPTKKVYGSKKGGAIRLFTPRDADVLVMGEGIESTLSAMRAHAVEAAAYWAGVDLGNMSGQRMLVQGLRYAGIPDMADRDAFVPPDWVRRLIYVQDGDSEPKLTRAKLLAGLRRAIALRPGLTAAIVHPGEGLDMNDLLMGGQND